MTVDGTEYAAKSRFIGQQIKRRRAELGLSVTDLAKPSGLTECALEAFEAGTRRASAAQFFELGQRLQVPVAFFFEGAEA